VPDERPDESFTSEVLKVVRFGEIRLKFSQTVDILPAGYFIVLIITYANLEACQGRALPRTVNCRVSLKTKWAR
jgi:hypothetical protein